MRAGRWAENDLEQGTYRLADTGSDRPEVLLIASGSEVALAVEAFEQLRTEGVQASLVSMPSWELFEQQSQEYRDNVLPPEVKARVAIEQASTLGWERYAGIGGAVLGMKTFGASAPLKVLQEEFGFTVANIVASVKDQIQKNGRS